jgi:hypothetical protein
VRTSQLIVRIERSGCVQKEARTGDDATGTLRTHPIEEIPSIISIQCQSITLTTLMRQLPEQIGVRAGPGAEKSVAVA